MLEIYSHFLFLVEEETIFFSISSWTILTATVSSKLKSHMTYVH